MKLAIELSETQEQRLSEIAGRLNVPAESLNAIVGLLNAIVGLSELREHLTLIAPKNIVSN